MNVDKIRSEVKTKPMAAKIDSIIPKCTSWLVGRDPVQSAGCRSALFRSRSQDLTAHVLGEARDRLRTAESLPECSFPFGVHLLQDNHQRRRDKTGSIEQLERENIELRSLIERLMAEAEVQQSTYRKQLEVISQLQNENECLREQREILMAPKASYHNRQRMGDFRSGDLDTIVEDQAWNVINFRIMFIEMRKFKRNREKHKLTPKRYHV